MVKVKVKVKVRVKVKVMVRVMVKVKVKVRITKTVQDEKTNNHTAIIIVIEPDSPYAGLEDKAR
jgi:hypothetical protein